MAGDVLTRYLRRSRRISRGAAAWRVLVFAFGLGAPAIVALVLHARLGGAGLGASLDRFGLAWGALVLLAFAAAAAARLRRGPSDAALAAALDRRHAGAGLFSAASFVLHSARDPGPLGDLVVARADSAAAGLPLPDRSRMRSGLKRAAVFFLLGLFLALVPGGPRGSLSGLGAGGAGFSRPDEGPASQGVAAAPESRNDRQVPLDEIASLELRSDHQIYPLGGEIHFTVEMKARRSLDADVPLEVVLAVADGLPFPDAGLGEGWRPVPLRLDWTLPKGEGGSLKQRFPMKETLQALGVYRPGLITARAFARPIDDTGPVSEGAGSNEVTIQISENKEDLSTKAPQPQGQEKQPEKQTPQPPKDQPPGDRGGGKSKPKLGDPDRLAGAQRVAHLVQPIVNAGPTIEKDVSVFEREPGGPAPPMPVAPKPPDERPSRTFLRRPEVLIVPPDLSVEERDVLRRYFDSLKAQKKL
jgi:hypothetical protein